LETDANVHEDLGERPVAVHEERPHVAAAPVGRALHRLEHLAVPHHGPVEEDKGLVEHEPDVAGRLLLNLPGLEPPFLPEARFLARNRLAGELAARLVGSLELAYDPFEL